MKRRPPTKKSPRKPRTAGTLKRALGDVPVDDSLATVSWAVRALGQAMKEVDADRSLTPAKKRAELVRLANAMAKLTDRDRLFAAEQAVCGFDRQIAAKKLGPSTQPVTPEAPGTPPVRRAPPGWRP